MKAVKLFASIVVLSSLLFSCKKYSDVGEAPYSDQKIYMPAAVEGNSISGIYYINKVVVPGQVYRYTADVTGNKLNVHLAVYRSGVNTKGSVPVTISVDTDTATKLLLSGKFPANTEVLSPANSSVPETVTIGDGEGFKGFDLTIDLSFLLANVTKKFAIGVGVSSPEKQTSAYGTTILLIDPSFLVPTANFSTTISGRTVSFSNTSTNAVSYAWNYGDGSAISTATAASYTYLAAGTYTITLTATGALGSSNASVKTASVTVL